jgi:hypothetical protein
VLSQTATREANILAYNDVFLAIAVMAAVLALWIFGRALWLRYVATLPAAAGPPPGPTALDTGPAEPPTDSPIATADGTPPLPVPHHPSRQ